MSWKKKTEEAFTRKAFTFEEFRDEVITPECMYGEDPDGVAEASIVLYIQEGYIEKTHVGGKTWYIRTGKELPPKELPPKEDKKS